MMTMAQPDIKLPVEDREYVLAAKLRAAQLEIDELKRLLDAYRNSNGMLLKELKVYQKFITLLIKHAGGKVILTRQEIMDNDFSNTILEWHDDPKTGDFILTLKPHADATVD